MPNPLINIGAAVNDGTGEVGYRGWLQKVNRLPVPDSTINAGSGDYTGTTEQKITAAIAAAVAAAIRYVWIPASLIPYNAALVTFNPAVMLLREGGPLDWYDVIAYGADPTATNDSSAALQAVINAAIANTATSNAMPAQSLNIGASDRGVWAPAGNYKYGTTLAISVTANQRGVTLRWVGGGAGVYTSGGNSGEPGGIAGELQGWGARFIYTGTTGDAFFASCAASAGNSRVRLDFEHLTFVGNKAALGAGAVNGGGLHLQSLVVTSGIYSIFKNVYVIGAKDNGIWLDGVCNCQWYNVQSNQNGLRGVYAAPNGAVPVFSPESGFYGCETSINGSHGLEIASGAGNSSFHSWTSNFNLGKALVLGSGAQRFHNFEAEVNQTSPIIDIVSSSSQNSFFGVQIVYFATSDVGFKIDSFGNAIYGWNSNGIAAQVELLFNSANAHHNHVQNWLPAGDFIHIGHITDNGYGNVVDWGANRGWGSRWAITKLFTVSGGGTVQTDPSQTDDFVINITANVAATIRNAAVTNVAVGLTQRVRYLIKNNSGGALSTAPVFQGGAGQFRTSSTFTIANQQGMVVDFEWDQVIGLYIQTGTPIAVAIV